MWFHDCCRDSGAIAGYQRLANRLRVAGLQADGSAAKRSALMLFTFLTDLMKKQYLLLAIAMLLTSTSDLSGQIKKTENKNTAAKRCAIQEPIKEDIDAQLAKFKQVKMRFNEADLSAKERKMVLKLVEAAQDLESIYWRQSDPKALELYKRLA